MLKKEEFSKELCLFRCSVTRTGNKSDTFTTRGRNVLGLNGLVARVRKYPLDFG